jgi:hypothetical protein
MARSFRATRRPGLTAVTVATLVALLNGSWEWLRGLDDEVHGQVSRSQGGRSWHRRCA